jgi:hypothetical protein
MFKKIKASSVREYLDSVPAERKKDLLYLHTFIKQKVPKLKTHFTNNMLGYGSFDYTNYKKHKIKWPVVALANQKQYISIYVCSVVGGEYVAEKNKNLLGNVKVGRGCISFKKLSDLNLSGLEKILRKAVKNPGLVNTTSST